MQSSSQELAMLPTVDHVTFLLYLILLQIIYFVPGVDAHAHYMVSTKCFKTLEAGTLIMTASAESSSVNTIAVSRGSTSLTSGDKYVSGETLSISITGGESLTFTDDFGTSQFVFEASNIASFTDGTLCSGHMRIADINPATLTLPTTGSGDVLIWAAWNDQSGLYGNPIVYITPTFTLTDPYTSGAANTSSNSTSSPSSKRTTSAQVKYQKYPSYVSQDLIIGLIFGIGGFILFLMTLLTYLKLYESGNWKPYSITSKMLTCSVVAVAVGAVATGLVSSWASDMNKGDQSGYLGKPSFSTNPLAWHPVLMVGGFFFSQVLAISMWSVFANSHNLGRAFHFLFHLGGAGSMIAGLAAIVKHKDNIHEESLTTIHSWIGVGAVVFYGLNYLLGLTMAVLTFIFPNSILRKAIDFSSLHRVIGLIAFGLSTIASITGIMNQAGMSGCYYLGTGSAHYSSDLNPANNYPNLPNSCKIANGVGVSVAAAAIALVVTVYTRSFFSSHSNVSRKASIVYVEQNPSNNI